MLYRNSTKVLMKVKMCITKHLEAVLVEERIYLLEKKKYIFSLKLVYI